MFLLCTELPGALLIRIIITCTASRKFRERYIWICLFLFRFPLHFCTSILLVKRTKESGASSITFPTSNDIFTSFLFLMLQKTHHTREKAKKITTTNEEVSLQEVLSCVLCVYYMRLSFYRLSSCAGSTFSILHIFVCCASPKCLIFSFY